MPPRSSQGTTERTFAERPCKGRRTPTSGRWRWPKVARWSLPTGLYGIPAGAASRHFGGAPSPAEPTEDPPLRDVRPRPILRHGMAELARRGPGHDDEHVASRSPAELGSRPYRGGRSPVTPAMQKVIFRLGGPDPDAAGNGLHRGSFSTTASIESPRLDHGRKPHLLSIDGRRDR